MSARYSSIPSLLRKSATAPVSKTGICPPPTFSRVCVARGSSLRVLLSRISKYKVGEIFSSISWSETTLRNTLSSLRSAFLKSSSSLKACLSLSLSTASGTADRMKIQVTISYLALHSGLTYQTPLLLSLMLLYYGK